MPSLKVWAGLALAVGVLEASCAVALAPVTPVAPMTTAAGTRFEVQRPDARSVALAGSFNQWSTSSHPLARDASQGVWSVVVRLPPGEHLFMYVVNGSEWITPPMAEDYVDDGFGARNGTVVVR